MKISGVILCAISLLALSGCSGDDSGEQQCRRDLEQTRSRLAEMEQTNVRLSESTKLMAERTRLLEDRCDEKTALLQTSQIAIVVLGCGLAATVGAIIWRRLR